MSDRMSKAPAKHKLDLFRLQEQLYNAHNFVVLARSNDLHRDRNARMARDEIEEIMAHMGYAIKEAQ